MANDDLRARVFRLLNADGEFTGCPSATSDALLALVQPELDRLTTENTILRQALREHESCSTCGHERYQHERDPILRAEWCRACATLDDLHDFTPTTEE